MFYQEIHLKDRFPFLGENGRDPILQVYIPENIRKRNADITDTVDKSAMRPSVLICPGGGYINVSPREGEPIAVHFFPEGFNTFILTYSVGERNRFPVQLREVAAAMEVIYENAAVWCCDTERIAIMGFSAGGHLAAHYTNYYHCPQVREVFPESKKVNASILCYPVITADPNYCHRGSIERVAGYFPVTEEDMYVFSCEYQVTEDTPPTFLWHTAEDDGVPVQNSLFYAAALAKHKVPFECHIYPFGCHGKATADLQTCQKIDSGTQYLRDWLTATKKWLSVTFHTE